MHQPMKDALRDTIEDLRSVINRIATKENATPEELAVLAEIANSITRMTGYARIEP